MNNDEKIIAKGYCYLRFEKDSIKVLCLSNKGFFVGDWSSNSIDDYIFINWSDDLVHTANLIYTISGRNSKSIKLMSELEDGFWDVCPIQKILNIKEDKLYIYLGDGENI
jgi:hypothetical protein